MLETKLVEDMAENLCKFAGATGAGLDEHLVRVHQAIQQDERHHLGKGKPDAAAGRAPTAAEVEELKKAAKSTSRKGRTDRWRTSSRRRAASRTPLRRGPQQTT